MPALVHTASDIELMLRRGLAPITDNATALMELGFERAYPQIRSGFDATIWERSIDLPQSRTGVKRLIRERAFLSVRS